MTPKTSTNVPNTSAMTRLTSDAGQRPAMSASMTELVPWWPRSKPSSRAGVRHGGCAIRTLQQARRLEREVAVGEGGRQVGGRAGHDLARRAAGSPPRPAPRRAARARRRRRGRPRRGRRAPRGAPAHPGRSTDATTTVCLRVSCGSTDSSPRRRAGRVDRGQQHDERALRRSPERTSPGTAAPVGLDELGLDGRHRVTIRASSSAPVAPCTRPRTRRS